MHPVDPVEFARLQERVSGLSDLKGDVKAILGAVQNIELKIAKTPTWEQLQPLRSDVESLKLSRGEARGAKKMLVLVGSTIGACSGIIGAVAGKIFGHPATASAVQHTSEVARGAVQLIK